MSALIQLVAAIVANLLGLIAANRFITGVSFGGAIEQMLLVAAVLTILNATLKPVLKLLFGPVILLTFGLGVILVNALMLFILDNLFQNLSIQGIQAFIYTAVLMSIVNFLLHIIIKK